MFNKEYNDNLSVSGGRGKWGARKSGAPDPTGESIIENEILDATDFYCKPYNHRDDKTVWKTSLMYQNKIASFRFSSKRKPTKNTVIKKLVTNVTIASRYSYEDWLKAKGLESSFKMENRFKIYKEHTRLLDELYGSDLDRLMEEVF